MKKEKKKVYLSLDTREKNMEFSKHLVSGGILEELERHEDELKDLSYKNIIRRLFGYFNYSSRGNRLGLMTWVKIIIPNVDRNKLDYFEFKRLIKQEHEKSEKFLDSLINK